VTHLAAGRQEQTACGEGDRTIFLRHVVSIPDMPRRGIFKTGQLFAGEERSCLLCLLRDLYTDEGPEVDSVHGTIRNLFCHVLLENRSDIEE
jgi:hypothetical protein